MVKHILVLDGAEEVLLLFQAVLHDEGAYKVTTGTLKPRVIEWVKEIKPDLVITALFFRDEATGWDLVDKMKMDPGTADIPVIVCTGAIDDVREREELLAERNIVVLYKPFDVDELLQVVEAEIGLAKEKIK